MECLPVASLPDRPGWVYELKLDGFRAQGIWDKSSVHLLSKNGKDFSKKFPQVCAALKEALPLGTAVDGELVAFDESGHLTDPQPRRPHTVQTHYIAMALRLRPSIRDVRLSCCQCA
jgi:ATP-dependent DNA ligase